MPVFHSTARFAGGRIKGLQPAVDADEPLRKGEASEGSAGEPGPEGPPGADGKSAYQVWLDEGNVGTEDDFFESLRGPQGIQGPPGTGGDGGGSLVRADVTANLASGTLAVGKTALLLAVLAAAPCRIRLYSTVAARTADADRPQGTLPAQGAGCLFEFVAVADLLAASLTPGVIAFNSDTVPVSHVYYLITPATSVKFTYLTTES